jgi:pimeloyl-ACP methyl ester carboxylesterase
MNVHRTYGLGVPLIAVRRTGSAPPDVEQYYAGSLSFPVTAFLRFDPDTSGHSTGAAPVRMRLELYDPLEVTDVHLAGTRAPLESDISTPLAYFLDDPHIQHLDTYGLLRPDKARRIAGLYMVQPYQPGKIPVLMVHGIWSSPMTWMEALNDLRAMPEIRERYQFWFYLYPTGVPFWETAANLRADLAEVRRVFGEGHDPALDQMVVVGHSMGGLISRLVTYDSDDAYWRTVSDTPFELVQAPSAVKENIRRVYFFEPDASIRRVVTIGSPYRGSRYASDALRLLARRFIALPMQTMWAAQQLLTLNPDVFRPDWAPVGLTSLDGLSPDNPILQTMLATPRPPWVRYHNIVGAIKDLPIEQNTDGVVAFASAHREDVESEIVVAAEHSQLHRHPRTILEIRRILLEHLEQLRDDPAWGVVPAGGER